MYTYGSRRTTPVIPPGDFPPDLESLLERMKRLYFSKPVTRRLTPGSNDYNNPNTNPTRKTLTTRNMNRGELTGGNHRGVHLLRCEPCYEAYENEGLRLLFTVKSVFLLFHVIQKKLFIEKPVDSASDHS